MSEMPRCRECGREFDRIESLREHEETERQEAAARNKGFDDG